MNDIEKKIERLSGKDLENYLDELLSFYEGRFRELKSMVEGRKLVMPEQKYKVGDSVFILWHGYIEEARIVDRTSHARYQAMLNDGGQVSRIESEIFPTRQALIEHQLQYWRNQLEDELAQHVSPYCEPTQDCEKCRNYRNTNNTIGYDCLCDEMKMYTQSNQHQVDVDRCAKCAKCAKCATQLASNVQCGNLGCVDVDICQHVTTFKSGFKCVLCGEQVLKLNQKCQHESDGMIYTSNPPQNKCIKCGEFYR